MSLINYLIKKEEREGRSPQASGWIYVVPVHPSCASGLSLQSGLELRTDYRSGTM
jgi:hypothetical protein